MLGDSTNTAQILDSIKSTKDVEGFVIRFDNGQHYKIKTNWYFTFHHSTTFLRFYGERHVWEAIMNDTYDDIRGLLPEDTRNAIDNFAAELLIRMRTTAERLIGLVEEGLVLHPVRLAFKQNVVDVALPSEARLLWQLWSDRTQSGQPLVLVNVVDHVRKAVIGALGSSKNLKKMATMLGDLSYEPYRKTISTRYSFAADDG